MPVANSAASAASSSLPKWQLALIVGAPVALGLGYMYYKNVNSTKSSKDSKGKKSNGNVTDKQISIDGEIPDKITNPETPTERAQRYKKLGNQAFGIGKYDVAIYYYNSAIEEYPKDETDELSKTYQNRAAAYDALEKYSAVKEDCTKALELNPTYVKALLRRARVMEKTNDLEKALEDVTAACILERFVNQSALLTADRVLKQLGKQHAKEHMLKRVPVMPSKHFIRTYFSSFRNDPTFNEQSLGDVTAGLEKALKAFRKQDYDDIIGICTEEIDQCSASDNSDKFKLYLIRGTFYLLLGEHKKAIDDLETVISNEEADKDLRVNALIKRATMYMQLENPDECFADFDKAVKINPNCGDIYHHRGQVYLLLDKINEACADSEMALKLNPNCGITFAQKSYTDYRYATMNPSSNGVSASPAIEKARADFQHAFELFPDCCECYTLYAQMLWDSQLYEEADLYFDKAIEKDPVNATIYVHRGLLQLQWTGNVEVGTKYIKEALECDDKCEFGYETLGTIEVQKGNLTEAIALFDKALTLARTELELTHIFSLQDAAKAQLKIGRILPKDSLLGLQGMH